MNQGRMMFFFVFFFTILTKKISDSSVVCVE